MYIYIYYFSCFCSLLSEKQKIDSGFFLFEAEQKAKQERIEKRQAKRKQNFISEEMIAISSGGNTTVTDEETL